MGPIGSGDRGHEIGDAGAILRDADALLAADPTLSDLRVEGATLEQAIVAMTTQESQEVAA